MNIPKSDFLSDQTFTINFIEFVWQFPVKEGIRNQIIFRCRKEGKTYTYLEEGFIDTQGGYIEDKSYATSGILTTKNLSFDELTKLSQEVKEYLEK